MCVLKLFTYIYSSGPLSVLNTWLSAPEGFEKGHCRGILSASQEPNKTRHIYGVSSIHRNGGIRKLQNKLRTNPTRRPHSHPWYHHPASSAPSETGAGKRSTFTSANIFLQKTIFYVYILCVSCVSVSSVFPVSANSLKKPKKSVYHMSSVESSTALAPFLSGSSVLESCLAGAFVGPCKFYV